MIVTVLGRRGAEAFGLLSPLVSTIAAIAPQMASSARSAARAGQRLRRARRRVTGESTDTVGRAEEVGLKDRVAPAASASAARSAATNSDAVSNRCAGSFASARRKTASSSSGRPS